MSKRVAEDLLLPERPAVQTVYVHCTLIQLLGKSHVSFCAGLRVQELRFPKFFSNVNGCCMMEHCAGSLLMSMGRPRWSLVVFRPSTQALFYFCPCNKLKGNMFLNALYVYSYQDPIWDFGTIMACEQRWSGDDPWLLDGEHLGLEPDKDLSEHLLRVKEKCSCGTADLFSAFIKAVCRCMGIDR